MSVASGRTAAVDQSDDPMGEVFVNAGETFHRDRQSSFLKDFAPNTVLEGFAQFKYTTGGLPAGRCRLV